MTPAEIGPFMRYADDLIDLRIIPPGAKVILDRLVFRYRNRDGRTASVTLDELAGDGISKKTVCRYLDMLERAYLIVKERCGAVFDGLRWRQEPNRYHIRTVEQAKAAEIAAAEERGEPEPEYHLFTVTLPAPSSECTLVTTKKSLSEEKEEDSTLNVQTPYPCEAKQEAQERESVAGDSDSTVKRLIPNFEDNSVDEGRGEVGHVDDNIGASQPGHRRCGAGGCTGGCTGGGSPGAGGPGSVHRPTAGGATGPALTAQGRLPQLSDRPELPPAHARPAGGAEGDRAGCRGGPGPMVSVAHAQRAAAVVRDDPAGQAADQSRPAWDVAGRVGGLLGAAGLYRVGRRLKEALAWALALAKQRRGEGKVGCL